MAGALKLAAAVAALAAIGWVVTGGTGPRQGAVQVDGPSPSPASIVGDDWAFFSGTVKGDGRMSGGTDVPHEVGGPWITQDITISDQEMATDDPRMNGPRTTVINLLSATADDSPGNLGSALMTIATDDGTWTCPMTYIHQITDKVAAGEIEQWAGWCEGSGAYVGLKAYLAFRQPDAPSSSASQEVYGFITSGDAPPIPEAPAS